MSKAWGGVGAWALDAERAEAEERERQAAEPLPASSLVASEPDQNFPSLKDAASSRHKKKKPTAMSFAQFTAASLGGGAGSGRRDPSLQSMRLTADEKLHLPTGPRERSQEELEYGRLGGGFRTYGGGGGGGPRGGFASRRADDGDGSWGGAGSGRRGYGGFDEEQRRGLPARVSDFDQPSRADEVDNWGAAKKSFVPPLTEGRRRDSYSSLSRADEAGHWSTAKKPLPSNYPGFGSGFGDSRSDRWGTSREGSIQDGQGRQKIVLDPPKRDAGAPSEPASTRPSPFGAARPREVVLAEKGLDWRSMDSEIEIKKTSRPASSHSSRPSSAQSSRPVSPGLQSGAAAAEAITKHGPRVNPFGNAKPREVLLQEKGIDWRKIDRELEHRSVERSETDEERLLKEEIDYLKTSKKNPEGLSSEELSNLDKEIAKKTKDLEDLMRLLDDKVRFGQKATTTRPGHGADQSDTSSTRPPSRSGMSDGSRSIEFVESVDRPQSRGGIGDAWEKTLNDRREFRRGRDKGFFDKRNGDRPNSRERW
ncbi:Eukaryotic translation initiation factor 4B [Musa troglodytarum]|uniref:Eukaryotic translation initiation factor 4B n=1 Tax=Musa troglodytarum TaxID=320322 RepID=A0A9E7K2Y5_9LILI|nr:Eukaryotic translation initiation factor 4B [Musa troglodytarum]